MATLRLFLLFGALAFSFGGFTLYAAVVVPIGSDVLDATSQGFVTQQVTSVLNVAAAVSWLLCAFDGIMLWQRRSKHSNAVYAVALTVYLFCLLTLVWLHPVLDGLLDLDSLTVLEGERFYNLHRSYLWVSTVQWCVTIVVIWMLCRARTVVPHGYKILKNSQLTG